MRKLLLNSTAIATVAALTSATAFADLAVSAGTEFTYQSHETESTATTGTEYTVDSEVAFKFSNKTDSGLTLGYVVEMESDGAATVIDESSLSIEGGFGKFVLGNNDNVSDDYAISALDLISEEGGVLTTSATIGESAGIADDLDATKIAYHMPAMGGLTAGVSLEDSGVGTSDTDITAYGGRYVTDAAGLALTFAMAGVHENIVATTTAVDIERLNFGVEAVSGNITVSAAKGTYKAYDEDRSTTDMAVSYKVNDDVTVGAYTMSSSDTDDAGEDHSKNGMEIQYTVAPGLKAFVNHDIFKYNIATTADTTGGTTKDSGSTTKLTIQAAF